MRDSQQAGGMALILFAVLYLVSFILFSPVTGLRDGDDPASSLVFIGSHPNLFFLSGLASAIGAIALVGGVLSVEQAIFRPAPTLWARTTTVIGLFAAAFFFGHGIMRMQAPGTLQYIESLNPEWGQAAYLSVQMAGTQGLGSAGIFALSAWAIGLSILGWGQPAYPRLLAILGTLAALPWIMGILARFEFMPEGLYLLYIGSILLGIPVWCALVGLFIMRNGSRSVAQAQA